MDGYRTVPEIVEEVLAKHHLANPLIGQSCEGYKDDSDKQCGERRDVRPVMTSFGIFYFCDFCRTSYRVQEMPHA